MFKIVDEETGEAVGSVGFWEKDWRGEQIYEKGWMVLKAHQGRGIASEATALVVEKAKTDGTRRYLHAFPPPQTARRTRSVASSASRFSARSISSFHPGTSRPRTTGASI
jgi:hypothetical protein